MPDQYITINNLKQSVEFDMTIEIFVIQTLDTFTIHATIQNQTKYIPFVSITTNRERAKGRLFKTLDAVNACIRQEIGFTKPYQIV